MNPLRYFFGRAMQIVGLVSLTYVVFMFFTSMGMEPLLIGTVVGASCFYVGTLILGRGSA